MKQYPYWQSAIAPLLHTAFSSLLASGVWFGITHQWHLWIIVIIVIVLLLTTAFQCSLFSDIATEDVRERRETYRRSLSENSVPLGILGFTIFAASAFANWPIGGSIGIVLFHHAFLGFISNYRNFF